MPRFSARTGPVATKYAPEPTVGAMEASVATYTCGQRTRVARPPGEREEGEQEQDSHPPPQSHNGSRVQRLGISSDHRAIRDW